MSVWVHEQLQSAKHTYNEPGRDVTWTTINALVISSDLCYLLHRHDWLVVSCCHRVK